MAVKAAAGPKPTSFVVEGNYHHTLSSGELVLPLKVSYKTFKKLLELSSGDDPLGDLERIIEQIGDDEAARVMEEADDVIEVLAAAMRYFELFSELAEARMGESKASSGD